MPLSINNNSLSLRNQRELGKTHKSLLKTFDRISSGKRITSAADDAAGQAIAAGMRGDIGALTMALRNANDGVSYLNIADSAQETAGQITGRLRELSVQAANGTLSDSQRGALNAEAQELTAELDRIGASSEFNGQPTSGEVVLQTGTDGSASSQTTVNVNGVSSASLGLDNLDLSSQAGAAAAIDSTEAAIATVAQNRGEIGAAQATLGVEINNIRTRTLTMREAESTISDADMAEEAANLTKGRIMLEMGASLGALSNVQSEMALKLLGNS